MITWIQEHSLFWCHVPFPKAENYIPSNIHIDLWFCSLITFPTYDMADLQEELFCRDSKPHGLEPLRQFRCSSHYWGWAQSHKCVILVQLALLSIRTSTVPATHLTRHQTSFSVGYGQVDRYNWQWVLLQVAFLLMGTFTTSLSSNFFFSIF